MNVYNNSHKQYELGNNLELHEKIKNIDLNLLKVFAVLDKTRSVTQSSQLLGISQPAMSHALSRLRHALNDPLFVKTSKQMVPTPKAAEYASRIHQILSQIQSALLGQEDFAPEKLQRVFRIKTTDFLEALIVPKLIEQLESDAPLVQISITSPKFSLPREELENGKCDLAIAGFFGDLPDGFYQQKLFDDGFKCAVRKEHPRLGNKRKTSLEAYCKERHVLIAPGGELTAKIDGQLHKDKNSRTIAAGLSNFMVSGWVISQSDTILTGPSRLIDLLAITFPLNVFPAPVKSTRISIVQVWHERNHKDPAHQWFRRKIQDCI